MENLVILIGRITKKPELVLTESGKKACFITLAVGRQFKNVDGMYDTDFLDCSVWSIIAERTAEYCNKGDLVYVRGTIHSRFVEQEDGSKIKRMEIVAERISFLSSNKQMPVNDVEKNEDIDTNEDNIVVKENKTGKKK